MTASIPMTDTIDVSTLQGLMERDPSLRILDVRTGGEFETVHIPGSYNVPLDTLGEHVEDLADVAHTVVLVCQSGNRASSAHTKLADAGKETLHLLDGGIAAWETAGGQVSRSGTSRWAMDRQVRLAAGTLALTGVALSTLVPQAKWLAGAVATGLVVSAVTDSCAMAAVLAKLPYNRTDRCDIAGVLRQLNDQAPVQPAGTA